MERKYLDLEGLSRLVSNINAYIDNTRNDHLEATNPHGITKETINLGQVENKSSEQIRSEITKSDIEEALGFEVKDSNTIKSEILEALNGMEDLF